MFLTSWLQAFASRRSWRPRKRPTARRGLRRAYQRTEVFEDRALLSAILTVTKAGTGSGTVVSSPEGIFAGPITIAQFADGTQVTLTATSAANSVFVGWSGAATGTVPTCTVAMTADMFVTATFALATFPLTVSVLGTGIGTVTSSPAGIDAPDVQSSALYAAGTTVQLTQSADSESTFSAWTGAAAGQSSTVVVTMDSAKNVGAYFSAPVIDYGDAPSPYPTKYADDGARHTPTGPTLGLNRDSESDGQPSAIATSDDTAGAPDDEDGVTFVTSTLLASGLAPFTAQVQIDLQNANPTSNRLDAWVDFNHDGDWSDSGEQIFSNRSLGTTNGVQTLDFTIPAGATLESTFARFRLSTAGGLAPTGRANDGEVEDYLLTFVDVPGMAGLDGSGNLVIQDLTAQGKNDALTLLVSGSNLIVSDPANALLAGSGATQVAENSISIPLASITGNIQVNALGGDDTLTVNFGGGNISVPVVFNGGTNGVSGDELILQGGSFGSIAHTAANGSDGSVKLDGNRISYTGLEPIIDNNSAVNRTFTFTGGAETITLSNSGTAGVTTLDSSLSESITFTNPTGSLTVYGGTGSDTINVTGLGSGFSAELNVYGNSSSMSLLGTLDYIGGAIGGEMDINPNGELIYISSGMGQTGWIRVNASDPTSMTSVNLAGGFGGGVAVDPLTGRYASTNGSNTLRVFNADGTTYDTETITGLGGSLAAGNGTFGISTQGTDRFQIYSQASGAIVFTSGSTAVGSRVEYNPATHNYEVRRDGSANFFTLETSPFTTGTVPSDVDVQGVNSVTNRLYGRGPGIGQVSVLNGSTHAVVNTISGISDLRDITVNSLRDRVYIGTDGQVLVYDGGLTTLLETFTLPGGYTIKRMEAAQGTDRLYVIGSKSGSPDRLFALLAGGDGDIVNFNGTTDATGALNVSGQQINFNAFVQLYSSGKTGIANIVAEDAIATSIATTSLQASTVSLHAGAGGIGTSGSPIVLGGRLNATTTGNGNQFLRTMGTVDIGGPSGIGLSAGTGTIELDGGIFQQSFSGKIDDSTKLKINGSTFVLFADETVDKLTLVSGSITSHFGGNDPNNVLTSTNTIEAQSGSIDLILAGANGLTKTTEGTLTLSRANTYSGLTSVNAGVLNVRHGSALGATSSGTTVADGASVEIQGGISVSEPLTLNGAGFSGGGALRNINSNNFWNGAITLASHSTIGGVFSGVGSELILSGGVGQSGGSRNLTVIGEISLVMGGAANTYDGTTSVIGANTYLRLRRSGDNNTILGPVVIGDGTNTAGLILDQSNQIADTADVTINNGGVLFLTAVFGFSTETIDELSGSGSVAGFGGGLPGPRNIGLTVGAGNGSSTYSGALDDQVSGALTILSLTKTGSGTLTLSGTNTYTGNTTVNNGTLLVNGSTAAGSAVSVQNGATLGGTGTVGDTVSVGSGGAVAPGTSPGILDTGNVTFASGSDFDVEIDGTAGAGAVGGHDQLDVTGTVTLNNGDLNVALGYVPAIGDAFTIINNNGSDAVLGAGTFQVGGNTIADGGSFLVSNQRFSIDYTSGTNSNDVTLTVEKLRVDLSVDANAGTEAGTTVITVTATAEAAVTGDQTVDVGVSGTGITAGDFSLSNTTITIADGMTSGSVTFTIVNDLLLEGTQTVTLSLSDPSSRIMLGTTTTQDIRITDNETGAVNFQADQRTSESVDPTIKAILTITSDGAGTVGLETPFTVTASDAGTGSATAGSDYATFGAQMLTFSASTGSATIDSSTATMDVIEDGETNEETIDFRLGPLSSNLDGQVTIVDDTHTVTIDTVNPTVTVNVVDSSLSDSDDTSSVSFEFSESVSDFVAGDIQVTGGTLVPGSLIGSGTSYTANVLADQDYEGLLTVLVAGTDFHDAVGNSGVSGDDSATVDTQNPTADILDVTPDPRTVGVSSIVVTFSEPVFGVDIDDFTLTHNGDPVSLATATLSGSDGDASYSISGLSSLTNSKGTYVLSLLSSSTDITDAADNEQITGATDDWFLGSTTITTVGDTITITDVGEITDDDIVFSLDPDNPGNMLVTFEGQTFSVPFTGVTNLVINGGADDDTLTIDFSNGPLPFDIIFIGGTGGHDSLVVQGVSDSGGIDAYTANFSNRHDGSLWFHNGDTIVSTLTYTGLEPISIDGTPAEIIFNLPSTNDTNVVLRDIGGADGFMRLTGSTFETTDFSIGAATSITINGNAGNDRVTIQSVDAGYTGELIVDGGAGNDVLTATASTIPVDLRGGAGNDTLTGSVHDDTLSGGLGNDSLKGGAGIDTVTEGDASKLTLKNTLLTGRGNDVLTSIERAVLTGTAGSNVLDASAFTLGNVTLLGGDGGDTLLGSAFAGATDGDGFNDSLDGGEGTDVARQFSKTNQMLSAGPIPGTTVATGAGSDLWTSIEGAHLVGSGHSAMLLDASDFSGAVSLKGGSGHDTLIGGKGNNLLKGNAGNDSLIGGDTADTMYGGAGNDTFEGRGGSDLFYGEAGNDTMRGGSGDDRLFGEAGADLILGGIGQDLIDGGSGNDVIDGESGHDTINGGAGSDALRGGDGDDQLNGNAGNDTLLGSSGDDVLRSGSGSDRLSGDSGNDQFIASGARITRGGGDDTIVGSNNRIDEVFVFDFDRLLI